MKLTSNEAKNIHDIGKYNGEPHGHEMTSYNYLKDKGYDEEYCDIC